MLTEADIGKEQKLTDKIKSVTWYNRATGYCIVNLEKTKCKACGKFKELAIDDEVELEDLTYTFTGKVVKNQYGLQFEFKDAQLVSSQGFYILTRYVKKVGPKLAEKIMDECPNFVELLESDNLEPLLKIKGVSKKTLENIREGAAKNVIKIQFESLLRKYKLNFTVNQVQKILDHFKIPLNCELALLDDPYCLLDIHGFGFKTVDEKLLESTLVSDKNSEKRLRFGLKYWLETQALVNGNTLVPTSVVLYGDPTKKLEGAIDMLGVDEKRLQDILRMMITSHEVHSRKVQLSEDSEPTEVVGLKKYFNIESNIKKNLAPRSVYFNRAFVVDDETREKFLLKFEKEHKIKFNAQQRAFIKLATSGNTRLSLVGYAGTGKTTVCSAVVELLKMHLRSDFSEDSIVSCAFTGVAAERIGSVAQCKTMTIHRLLGFGYRSEDKQSGMFAYNADNKLNKKVVLLDESSMIDVELYNALVSAIPTSSLFVTIGDPAQLPPIGAGNVFSDIIKQQLVPSVELTEIYRQSKDSVLTQFAEHIRHGNENFIASENIGFTDYKDFNFVHRQYSREHSDEFNHSILNLVLKQVKDLIANGVDKDDIQVLSPQHTTVLGTSRLNEELQKYFVDLASECLSVPVPGKDANSQDVTVHKNIHIGDRMIHLRNMDVSVKDYDLHNKLLVDQPQKARVFNGYIGKVVDIDKGSNSFVVDYLIKGEGLPIHRRVTYNASDVRERDIDFAYAMTIHKSQGSQYKHVVIPIVPAHIYQLNNQLLYTAITRAKDKVHLVGTTYAFRQGVKNTSVSQRLTHLSLGDDSKTKVIKRFSLPKSMQSDNEASNLVANVDDNDEFGSSLLAASSRPVIRSFKR